MGNKKKLRGAAWEQYKGLAQQGHDIELRGRQLHVQYGGQQELPAAYSMQPFARLEGLLPQSTVKLFPGFPPQVLL